MKTGALAALLAFALPAAAMALPLTFTEQTQTIDNRGSATGGITVDPVEPSIEFTWAGTNGGGNGIFNFQAFTVSTPYFFELYLSEYLNDRVNDTTLITVFSGIQTSGGSSSPNFISDTVVRVADASTPLLIGVFESGDYTIKITETGSSRSGSAKFEFQAVPLPAGAGLLVTALGGLVVLRRRKKPDTAAPATA